MAEAEDEGVPEEQQQHQLGLGDTEGGGGAPAQLPAVPMDLSLLTFKQRRFFVLRVNTNRFSAFLQQSQCFIGELHTYLKKHEED